MANLPDNISEKAKDKFIVENQTLARQVKSNPKDKIQIEIGDSKQSDFKPQFKVMRWDNEVNFSLRAQEHPSAVVEVENDVVKYKTPDYEVHQYDKPEAGEDGGFEFEWLLPKKPSSNVLTATIQTKGLDFFYQPELTQEEIDEGYSRPVDVVGSYAVYHSTKSNNITGGKEYRTGKAFHIYRPKVTDANGNTVYADLDIDLETGMLNVIIPQSFLDSAIYPVLVDPTFGYTTSGGSFVTVDQIRGVIATAPSDATIDSISVYHANVGISTTFKGGIYKASDGSFVGQSDQGTYTANSGEQLKTMNVSSSFSVVNGTSYLIVTMPSTGQMSWRYDSTVSDGVISLTAHTYPTFPATITNSFTDSKHSVYATYTVSGATTSTSTSSSTTTTSTSTTSTSTSTTTTISPTSGGLAFGEQSPTNGEGPVSWQTFSDGVGGVPTVIGDQNWGKMELNITEEGKSKVYDFGNSVNRTITLTRNRYGTGQGTSTLQFRGHDTTAFAQDSDEIAGPAWENYSTPTVKTWRYIQVREIKQS
jgi:hypothetical protein